MQKELYEKQTVEKYKRMKKELKDKQEILQVHLKGDKQRTKNVLQDHPKYQQTYVNKQSYEVVKELETQAFLKRKKLDSYMGEKNRLIKEYEKDLVRIRSTSQISCEWLIFFQLEVAFKQEMIRYHDVKEFKHEIDSKRLFVELKNSETRSRAIQKINSGYKKIIDQLLKDSLYYKPVLDAINSDWKEQSMLVKQTYEIGFPAVENAKQLEKDLKKLHKVTKKEENQRLVKIMTNRQILKEQPKILKSVVRTDVSRKKKFI